MTEERGRLQNKSNLNNNLNEENKNTSDVNNKTGDTGDSLNQEAKTLANQTGRTMGWGGNLNSEINPAFIKSQLQSLKYPCSKDQLLAAARREGLGDNVMSALNALPNQKFSSVNDIVNAMGSTEL